MADLINPSGTLARGAIIMGFSNLSDGDTSVTITLPLPGRDAYMAKAECEGWQTTKNIVQGVASFTVTFSTPAPAGAKLRWEITLA